MLTWFKSYKIDISQITMVMEHTGLYSFCLEKFLYQEGICFCKVNAVDIKLSQGVTRGKSDKMDALRIAIYGREKYDKLKAEKPISNALQELKMLNTSRSQLVRTRSCLKCAVKEFQNIGMSDRDMALQAELKVIKALDKEIKKLEDRIEVVIHRKKPWLRITDC